MTPRNLRNPKLEGLVKGFLQQNVPETSADQPPPTLDRKQLDAMKMALQPQDTLALQGLLASRGIRPGSR